MRIIRKGTIPEVIEYEHTCWKCGTVFAATTKDRFAGQYNESTVKCPVCQSYVDWSNKKPLPKEMADKDMEQEILDEFSKIMRK